MSIVGSLPDEKRRSCSNCKVKAVCNLYKSIIDAVNVGRDILDGHHHESFKITTASHCTVYQRKVVE